MSTATGVESADAARATAEQEKAAKRHFYSLWAGEGISAFGARITTVAIPLIAVTVLKAPDWQIGLLVAADGICYLLFGLHAGAWVDRHRRRPVLVTVSLLRAALLGLVPLAAALDRLTMALLIGVAFALAGLTMVFDVALFAFIPLALPRTLLTWGNARFSGTESVAHAAGPAVAGALIRLLSAPPALLAGAVGYLFSALGARLVPIREQRRRAEPGVAEQPIRHDILDGLRFLKSEKLLLLLACISCLYNVFATVVLAALVPHLVREAGLGADAVGLVYAATGAGGVLGAALVARLSRRSAGTSLWACPTLCFAVALAVPWGHGWVAAVCAGVAGFAVGLGEVVYNTAATTIRQSHTPPEMLGRLRSALRTAAWSGGALGGLGGGALASAASPRLALIVGSVGCLLVFLAAGLTPVRTATVDHDAA